MSIRYSTIDKSDTPMLHQSLHPPREFVQPEGQAMAKGSNVLLECTYLPGLQHSTTQDEVTRHRVTRWKGMTMIQCSTGSQSVFVPNTSLGRRTHLFMERAITPGVWKTTGFFWRNYMMSSWRCVAYLHFLQRWLAFGKWPHVKSDSFLNRKRSREHLFLLSVNSGFLPVSWIR